MQALIKFYHRRFGLVLVVAMAAAMFYAFHRQLIVDDAYISFRYALNLVDGQGLVWNPGERVEGYSNFIWVLLVALGMKLGIAPEPFTFLISIPIQLASLILTYILARVVSGSRSAGLVVMLLVGLNHSVATFATSGMETPLQLLEFLAVACVITSGLRSGWTTGKTLGLSLLLNLALLTRPDSVVLTAAALAAWYISRRGIKAAELTALLLPFTVIFLPYLIWKVVYYGSILPNAFYVKVRGLSGLAWGLYYLYLFTIYYMLLPYVAALIWRGGRLWRDNRQAGIMALFTLTWAAYVVQVGGDFMEFRFLVPVLPFLMIGIVCVLKGNIADRKLVTALVAALFLGTFNNMFTFGRMFYSYGIETSESLRDHITAPGENWMMIGKRLGELFEGTDVTVAVGAAGVIPYYSGLKSVDFIGLTDKVIPRIGEPFSTMPGHRVIAPLEYLYQRGVNLIVQPINLMFSERDFRLWARAATWREIYKFFMDVDKPLQGRILGEVQLIGIPVDKGYTLVAWYLTPHEAIDRVIREQGLRRIRLTRR